MVGGPPPGKAARWPLPTRTFKLSCPNAWWPLTPPASLLLGPGGVRVGLVERHVVSGHLLLSLGPWRLVYDIARLLPGGNRLGSTVHREGKATCWPAIDIQYDFCLKQQPSRFQTQHSRGQVITQTVGPTPASANEQVWGGGPTTAFLTKSQVTQML